MSLTVKCFAAGPLGENTDEILASMGYTPEQIRAMKEAGAVK